MWASCFSFVSNLRQLLQSKLSVFECGAEQRFDLHNNFLLDFLLHASMQQEQGLFTIHTPHLRPFVVRLINISKKMKGALSIQSKLSKIWRQRQIV